MSSSLEVKWHFDSSPRPCDPSCPTLCWAAGHRPRGLVYWSGRPAARSTGQWQVGEAHLDNLQHRSKDRTVLFGSRSKCQFFWSWSDKLICRCNAQLFFLLLRLVWNVIMWFSGLKDSYLAAWKGHSPPFYTCSPASDAQAASQECSRWTLRVERWWENERKPK